MFKLLAGLAFLVACSSGAESEVTIAPSREASATLAIYADSAPAAPTNVAFVVDSTDNKWAYLTFTWTDNTSGRAKYQLYTLYNGAPNAYAITDVGATSLSTKIALRKEYDFYLRSLIYINDVVGVPAYSDGVGPVHVNAQKK